MGRTPAYAIVCGAGSAGHVWAPVADRLGAIVLPAPDEPDVAAMAGALRARVERLPRPRVVIGSSLGALIALELARDVRLDALILIAAGFGIAISPSVIDTIAANAPGMLARMAGGIVADRTHHALVEAVARDFEARGPAVLLRHMRALARHRPEPLPALPPTFVLWGMQDPGVPPADHAELAVRCGAPLLPIADAGHVAYFEQPDATLGWIHQAVRWAEI
jgi:pimeloyl-ACP methyl ester carboxylesterase